MLHIIGLGLDDGEITVKAEEVLEEVDKAYAEFYTNTETVDVEKLEELTGTEIQRLGREEVEQEDKILKEARHKDTAFLVSGDPLTATTHYDIKHRAEQNEIEVKVYHAPSIITSVGETGLNVYKFGRTVTLPKDSKPESVTRFIERNDSVGLHTLVLLDINYDARDASEKILSMEPELENRTAVVIERANTGSQKISVTKMDAIENLDLEDPPHSIVIVGDTSHKEKEFLEAHR